MCSLNLTEAERLDPDLDLPLVGRVEDLPLPASSLLERLWPRPFFEVSPKLLDRSPVFCVGELRGVILSEASSWRVGGRRVGDILVNECTILWSPG